MCYFPFFNRMILLTNAEFIVPRSFSELLVNKFLILRTVDEFCQRAIPFSCFWWLSYVLLFQTASLFVKITLVSNPVLQYTYCHTPWFHEQRSKVSSGPWSRSLMKTLNKIITKTDLWGNNSLHSFTTFDDYSWCIYHSVLQLFSSN